MARPKIDGMSYFPFDVDFFSDRKIKIIRGSELGVDAVIVYIYLLCEIYKCKGYYIDYTYDLICCAAADTGIPECKIRQIVKMLVIKDLFSISAFEQLGVLTSEAIQKRYQEIKKSSRRDIEVNSGIWILKNSDTQEFIKVLSKNDNHGINYDKSGNNPDNSGENALKKSKENKNILKESKENASTPLTADALRNKYGDKLFDNYLSRVKKYYPKSSTEKQLAIVNDWLEKDGKKPIYTRALGHTSSLNIDEIYQQMLESYNK